jgi:hypothetical protein
VRPSVFEDCGTGKGYRTVRPQTIKVQVGIFTGALWKYGKMIEEKYSRYPGIDEAG